MPEGRQQYSLRVPASSANLGPGFDALGVALGVFLECRFTRSERLEIVASGRDVDSISKSEDNLIWQTTLDVAQNLGRTLPPIRLEIRNDIPLGKGLGSSAAALVAGVLIADKLLDLGWDEHKILDEAARIEGHPDNVAACVLGSIVASAIDSDGVARAVRLELPPAFGINVVVPDFTLPTSKARAALPAQYSRADAVFNVQRSALLIAALATGNNDAFPAALGDRMHQPYRAPLVPGLPEILALRRDGLLGCCLSGAGPSVLVFYKRGHESVCDAVRQVFVDHGHGAEVLRAPVTTCGYMVREETFR